MAAVLTGTPTAVTWASGANPAGQTITITADATAVYMTWSYYHGTAGHGLASATLAGDAPDAVFEVATAAGDQTSTGVAVWYNPPTGSQTLDVAWDAAPAEGPITIAAYVKGGDTTAWRDVDAANETSTIACGVTLTTQASDLGIKLDQRFSGTAPALSSGWSDGQTATNVSEAARLSYISAAGTSQACDCEGENYSSVVAFAIPPAAVGGGFKSAWARGSNIVMQPGR